ncbi:MAG TPA: DUF3300 domain-containing protein [Bryobacteraceae bacterium]|nr:DUF3300 domain-containing protein [Bryobacteraceae bacterium]
MSHKLKLHPTAIVRAAAVAVSCLVLAPGIASPQNQPPPLPPPDQTWSSNQLDNLVAPIALYPDPLLSQVLVAATYPLEVVQAYQWLQRNPGLQGPALTQAAQQQNWDASIQALVMFPDVLKRLNDDVTWTTNLGNAFLAQQQDVMDAVQRMRAEAQQAGRLASTPQENVVPGTQNGQPVIEIMPVDPNIIYVPVYDPVWIWGPAVWYPYPRWWWPPRTVVVGGLGFGFLGGINVGFYFGAGWHGWGGWGWHPGWGNHTVIVNNTFIHQNNFSTVHIDNVHGSSTWVHDPAHRQGVPYARPELNQQYRAPIRQNIAPRPSMTQMPSAYRGQSERVGNRQVPQTTPPAQSHNVFGGQENGRAAQTHAEHGYSSMGAMRSAPVRTAPPPRPAAPAPRGGRR